MFNSDCPASLWMRRAATLALAAAEREPAEEFTCALSALIHCALAAEAFFEELGSHLDRHWPAKRRRFSRYKRLRVFRLVLGIEDDVRARPWRSVAEAFDFHDLVMRGFTETEEKREALALDLEELPTYSIAPWKEFCTLENVRRVLHDTELAMMVLGHAARLPGYASNRSGPFPIQLSPESEVAPCSTTDT